MIFVRWHSDSSTQFYFAAILRKLLPHAVKDFLYLDPPYRPGEREQLHAHYMFGEFNFEDHKRLASCLREATERGVQWVMTNSSHPDILALYEDYSMYRLDSGTGSSPGQITTDPGEMVISHVKRCLI